MGEPIREEWIAAAVAGKSFAEVGGLWGTVNDAEAAGPAPAAGR